MPNVASHIMVIVKNEFETQKQNSDRKDLGNLGGDDGWNFRGRGIIQLTGRGGKSIST